MSKKYCNVLPYTLLSVTKRYIQCRVYLFNKLDLYCTLKIQLEKKKTITF